MNSALIKYLWIKVREFLCGKCNKIFILLSQLTCSNTLMLGVNKRQHFKLHFPCMLYYLDDER